MFTLYISMPVCSLQYKCMYNEHDMSNVHSLKSMEQIQDRMQEA